MSSSAASNPHDAQAMVAAEHAVPELEGSLVLWLKAISHALNHFHNRMVSALCPVIMAELGFSSFQLGTITAIRTV